MTTHHPSGTARGRRLAALVATGVLAIAGLTLPAASAQAAPVLLSQGKTATASTTESADYLGAKYAVDGDNGTRWASQATDNQWIQVDLGASASIERVDLRWESAYGKGYQIQTSDNGTTWTTVATKTNGTGGKESLTVTGTGRYVRLQGTARATGYGYSLWEFQVFGTAGTGGGTGGGGGTGTCGTTNVAQGKTATASSSEGAGTAAPFAVDGKADTRWASSFADNQWFQVDLGSSQQVCQVALSWEGAYGKAFQVQLSDNGTTWTTAATVTNGTGGNQTVAAAGTGRYLRLNLQTRATGYGFSLWEVAVNTTGGGTTDPGTGGGNGGLTGHGDVVGPADGKVRLIGSQGNWTLAVNGKKWVTKGMTWGPAISEFPANVANFKELGVNTIRTWGTDAGSKALFDAAATAGIRVVAGFWLAPGGGPGSGGCPNYVTDATYKANSMNDIVTWITAYKDNPGVLMWDVGNESLLGLGNCYSGAELETQRAAYATFVNDAAKRIHQIDPNHPVTSTDAWTGAWPYLKANAPDLDLYGLNSYGAICDAKQTWINGGYTKPYLITEGGPAGEWEVPNDVNGVPDQGTDQQNADGYTKAWNCIGAHPGVALGATLFHYGNEGDFGGIWFNIKPGNNKRLSYYAVAKAYGGTAATGHNTPPKFSGMTIANQTGVVAGANVSVNASATDPDGDAITYHVFVNSNYINKSGGLQEVPFTRSGSTFTFTAPQTLGVWKAYVFAEDGKGNVGVETRSFRVIPPAVAGTNIAQGKTATASSFDPYNGNFTPGQAVDGSFSTRWSSSWADAEWIQVDLGSKRTFSNVQLVWESAFAKGYLIQQSDNGTTWTTLSTITNGDGNVDTVGVNGNARYVRIQGVTRGTAYGYSLYELGVYA
ncbi:discoidin domain-containing protein [Cellulomonas rhizosphaerae]|uniref:Coagulation factor 5/8 type domain protein n=1 Tax=Cellulomonas rhizosphaerae TaxID=2293719 RepID=A0A413RKW4_9CELL|nr:discoidin domain-containing protein [Cellulomonas rhizosphaerae]RHA40118.1 coagulation factor 5/8 type domain protein [Cellulomonas rhizosphaerae]